MCLSAVVMLSQVEKLMKVYDKPLLARFKKANDEDLLVVDAHLRGMAMASPD